METENEFKIGDCVVLKSDHHLKMVIEKFDSAGNEKGATCVWLADNKKHDAYFLLTSLIHCPKPQSIIVGRTKSRNSY